MNARAHFGMSMLDQDRVKLLGGPYPYPPYRNGDRTFCLYRDCDVVVTSWTNGRIPWPRCRSLEARRGEGSGLLVDETLATAIRTESAEAIKYWWGVGTKAVWKWRKALGVVRLNNPGSMRLIVKSSMNGADAIRDVPLPAKAVEERRQRALKLNLGRNLWVGYHGPTWTKKELSLLGTKTDEEVAKSVSRSVNAVRIKRSKLGIPKVGGRPYRYWTSEEMELLLSKASDQEIAERLGRTLQAVIRQRNKIQICRRSKA